MYLCILNILFGFKRDVEPVSEIFELKLNCPIEFCTCEFVSPLVRQQRAASVPETRLGSFVLHKLLACWNFGIKERI
jgi:hypothetical protein